MLTSCVVVPVLRSCFGRDLAFRSRPLLHTPAVGFFGPGWWFAGRSNGGLRGAGGGYQPPEKRGRDLAEHERARRNQGVAGGRRPFRASGQALESQDEALHLRPADGGAHYRS